MTKLNIEITIDILIFRDFSTFLMIFLVFAAIYEVKSKAIECESILTTNDFDKKQRICVMNGNTSIDSKDVTVSNIDKLMETLKFEGNRNIT
jgi:hypothetical protein